MPIEINYFALSASSSRIKSGHRVAQIDVRRGVFPYISYEFIAEQENTPIVAILCLVFNRRAIFELQLISVDKTNANRFKKWLSELPPPAQSSGTSFPPPEPDDFLEYLVLLDSEFENFHYQWSSDDNLNMPSSFEQRRLWFDRVEKIVMKCEELIGNPYQVLASLLDSINMFQEVSIDKPRFQKYRKSWHMPTLPSYHRWQRDKDFQLVEQFVNLTLGDDLQTQINFRAYLSWLLRAIAITTYGEVLDASPIFEKIKETDVHSWDEDEQEALSNYFKALWDYILAYYPSLGMDAYTFIHGFQLTGLDVTPYIKHWKSSIDDISASRHLADYVQSLYEQYVEDGIDVFYDVPKILQQWLHEIAEGDYFLKRYMEYDDVRPFADEFAEASDVLSMLRGTGL